MDAETSKKVAEIMANKDNMTMPELLEAISFVSGELRKRTSEEEGRQAYSRVEEGAKIMAECHRNGITEYDDIKNVLKDKGLLNE